MNWCWRKFGCISLKFSRQKCLESEGFKMNLAVFFFNLFISLSLDLYYSHITKENLKKLHLKEFTYTCILFMNIYIYICVCVLFFFNWRFEGLAGHGKAAVARERKQRGADGVRPRGGRFLNQLPTAAHGLCREPLRETGRSHVRFHVHVCRGERVQGHWETRSQAPHVPRRWQPSRGFSSLSIIIYYNSLLQS